MTVLIVGGTGAIGRALAGRLAAGGSRVLVSGRRPGADCVADLTLPADLARIAALAENCDTVVFAAGVWRFAGLNRFSAEDITRTIAVNLTAPIEITRLLLPAWRARQHGQLVYILSELAHQPQAGGALYCATKSGLLGFADSLRLETRDAGIRVLTVSPGIVNETGGITPAGLADRIVTALADGSEHLFLPTPP